MKEVALVRCNSYDPEECREAMEKVLAPLGGLNWVQAGMRIVIKANLVSAMKPEQAATTHPELLCALVRALVGRGARVVVGDSPGGLYNATFLNRVYKITGMEQVEAAGAELNRDFSQKEARFADAYVAKQFSYTGYLDNADAIISFAKLKSHGMMSLSAATKNLFGAVPGTIKPEYHFRYPDPMDFAGMILDLNRYFKPRLYLVDGVIAMEGNGPTAGTPRHMGVLLAGTDCHRLDMVCARLIGQDPMDVPTLRAAVKYGLLPENIDDPKLEEQIASFVQPDFQRIEGQKGFQFENVLPGKFGLLFSKIASNALRSKPKLMKSECVGCGVCKNVCPANAIEIVNGKAMIERKKCIRCFCCQEFCPKGAMKVHRALPARILNK